MTHMTPPADEEKEEQPDSPPPVVQKVVEMQCNTEPKLVAENVVELSIDSASPGNAKAKAFLLGDNECISEGSVEESLATGQNGLPGSVMETVKDSEDPETDRQTSVAGVEM